MNPRKVEKPDVAAAMKELVKQGINPSADAILEKIGIGSKTTILKLRKQVLADMEEETQRAQERADAALVSRIPMPESIARRIDVVQASIDELALAFAEAIAEERERAGSAQQDALAAMNHSHDKVIKDLKEQLADLQQRFDTQQAELKEISDKNAELLQELSSAQEGLRAVQVRNNALTEQLLKILGGDEAIGNGPEPENRPASDPEVELPFMLKLKADRLRQNSGGKK